MAENPRHGDEIIVKKKAALGGERLIASREFQAFLDDLAGESDQLTDVSDLVQLIAVISDQNQQLYSEIVRTNKIVKANSQELAIMQTELNNLRSGFSVLGKQLNNVEQLANVN